MMRGIGMALILIAICLPSDGICARWYPPTKTTCDIMNLVQTIWLLATVYVVLTERRPLATIHLADRSIASDDV